MWTISTPYAPPLPKPALEEGTDFTPKFDADGLITCVTLEHASGEILMLAHMNAEALSDYASAAQTALVKPATSTGTTTTIGWNYGTNAVIAFNPAIDKLNFGWMTSPQFTVAQQNGSTVISIVGNNQTYTLKNVTLAQMTMTNIIANDSGTVSTWQTLITNAAQATSDTPSTPKSKSPFTIHVPLAAVSAFVPTCSKAKTSPVSIL